MKTLMKILLTCSVLLLFVGCVATKQKDGTTKWNLDPAWGQKAEETGEVALDILTVLAPLLGPAGGIAVGGVATGLTMFKKARPKLERAQSKYELSNTIAAISVDALETIKNDHPAIWKQLGKKLQQECEDSGLDTKMVKNAIRGLRGKPPKV